MDINKLKSVAQALVAPGKGILAADESAGTIEKRLSAIGLQSTDEIRRTYRQLLFTTQDIAKYISGVILYDETIRQASDEAVPFPKLLAERGIIPGIKVDAGAKDMANFPGEKITEGLDGLRERFLEYTTLGAQFAKWRAVITIGNGIPTDTCLTSNSEALARYAALCQEAGLVPIVEPEVLMDGSHDIEKCRMVTYKTLKTVFIALANHKVDLSAMLLKPNMVISGKDCPQQASAQEIAGAILKCFSEVVPGEVPGIVFLSGGQTPQRATENLNAINSIGNNPWQLSFSYSRALQEPVLKVWSGKVENVGSAQKEFAKRAKLNSLARDGKYLPEMENEE